MTAIARILVLLSIIIGSLSFAACTPQEKEDQTRGYAACENEDSDGPCYWDAEVEGNGNGRSFTVLEDNSIEYWD